MCKALGLGVEPPCMYKTLLSGHPPPPTWGIIVRLLNWTGQNDPWRTRRPPALLFHYTIMKDEKHQFLTHKSERLIINYYTEKLLFNIHPNYSSQRYERSSFAIGLRDRTPRHSATSRNHRNVFGIFRKSWKFFSEMRIKCIRKSLSFDSWKENSFHLCCSPF